MRIESLECFLSVSKTLNYSISAVELHVTQSTISRTIKLLEEEFGCALFLTNKGKVTLTEEGAYLAEHIPLVLENYNQIKKEISYISNHQRYEINIGIVGFGEEKLHQAIYKMMGNDPEIQVHLCPVSISEAMSKVLNGELDCCTTFSTSTSTSTNSGIVGAIPMCKEKPLVYFHEKHPLNRKKKITMEDIRKYKQIVFGASISDMQVLSVSNDKLILAKDLKDSKILLEMNRGIIFAFKNDNLDSAKNCECRLIDDYERYIEMNLVYLIANDSVPLMKLIGYLKNA